MKRIVFVILLVLLIVGCGPIMRSQNRNDLMKVEKGMSVTEVKKVMSLSPYKREIIRDRQGIEYEILYYKTEFEYDDWEENMTPVILKENKVVGIGWRYIENSDLNVNMTFKRK